MGANTRYKDSVFSVLFSEKNATEVINMLMTEWNWDDALAVRFEEGQEDKQEEIARNALAEGVSIEFVKKITGLDMETIKKLQGAVNNGTVHNPLN